MDSNDKRGILPCMLQGGIVLITLHERGVYLVNGAPQDSFDLPAAEARKGTMA